MMLVFIAMKIAIRNRSSDFQHEFETIYITGSK